MFKKFLLVSSTTKRFLPKKSFDYVSSQIEVFFFFVMIDYKYRVGRYKFDEITKLKYRI